VSRSRIHAVLLVIAVGAGLLAAFVAGLFVYMNATARPLHPDPPHVPSAAAAAPAPAWSTAVEKGRQAARAGLVSQNLPGLSVAVGSGGDVVWAEGFGYADIDKRTGVTPATKFKIADVSIPLTSAAAGLLVEQERLNLDTVIQTYVPEFPDKQWPVTVRELMANVGGMRTDAGDEEPIAVKCPRPLDGIERFKDSALLFEPGTRFRQSSYGWILVSAAIEAAANTPFYTFMRAKIFEPLAMSSTRPDSMTEQIPDRATMYFPRFAGDPRYGPDLAREGDHSCFAGAGAFLSTPSDLVRFGMAMNGTRLLRRSTVQDLQTPQRLITGEETGYGLGWKIETIDLGGAPARMAGHGTKPDFIGGTASLLTFPERGLAVAVTSNTGFADTRSIALAIAQAFAAGGSVPPR
jgi:CubicO group peptidase (beta-lactamase class C family)